jgi:WD40 repeat protein
MSRMTEPDRPPALYGLCPDDHVIRIWDTSTRKTVAKLDTHVAEDKSSACLAWSPNGEYLAFASCGAPPWGCVAVYVRNGEDWKLASPVIESFKIGDNCNQRENGGDNAKYYSHYD